MTPNNEQPLFGGSSKLFYPTEDPAVLRVQFMDVMHGRGRELEVPGTGRLREEFCYYFYRLLKSQGIRTHIADQVASVKLKGDEALIPTGGILVRRLDMIALELIRRYVARGYWVDEHKVPVFKPGKVFDPPITEMCLKWKEEVPNLNFENLPPDQREIYRRLEEQGYGAVLMPKTMVVDDPRISLDVARNLHKEPKDPKFLGRLVENEEEWNVLRDLTIRVNDLLREFMRSMGWDLEDGKFEAGIIPGDTSRYPVVGDEYTQDSSRVRGPDGASLTKDLHRQQKPAAQIYDAYARLTEAMKSYSK